ncbi:DUF3027 domain-containing protein [Nocardia cyriacigeorgica]|uniref:DUF3027 domain-containing protein n=1 Tax=Nocardia cyriacigeorgica TaxID=135487 RepID=A0A5R8P9E7_9NOCA|nr:DUF3027 domain-containing protein [Nocardia cyriacigeorgica]
MRPVLADAVELARRALLELEPSGVGAHLGVSAEDDNAATHRFEATLTGYRGWQWAVVVAAPPGADRPTVSESALLPGPDALIAPEFVPWDQRVRPGDLAPGDLLAPPPNDPRLAPGYTATGDPEIDDVAYQVGLGRSQVLSLEGREEAAQRWYAEFGPDTEMAKAAPGTCGTCGFYLPLAGALRACFGVCGNAMGADGHVVHTEYGCGAHSDVTVPSGAGSPLYEAYDDAAVDLVPKEALRGESGDAGSGGTASAESAEAAAADSGGVAGSAEVAGVTAPAVDARTGSANVGTEAAESGSVESAPAAEVPDAPTSERVEPVETAAADAGATAAVEASGAADAATAAEPADRADTGSTAEATGALGVSPAGEAAGAADVTAAVESAGAADAAPAAEAAGAADVPAAVESAGTAGATPAAEATDTPGLAAAVEPSGPATAVEPADSDSDQPADAASGTEEVTPSSSEAEQPTASVPEPESSNGTGESEVTADAGDSHATDAQPESGSSALS